MERTQNIFATGLFMQMLLKQPKYHHTNTRTHTHNTTCCFEFPKIAGVENYIIFSGWICEANSRAFLDWFAWQTEDASRYDVKSGWYAKSLGIVENLPSFSHARSLSLTLHLFLFFDKFTVEHSFI